MCGIAGYVGGGDAVATVIESLRKLSYRGYDSAGITCFKDGDLYTVKCAGKIENLEKILENGEKLQTNACIGHTRWATHGVVSDENSHPHGTSAVSIVHNGIIENYLSLKQKLRSFGYGFTSETDTEVGALMIDYFYKKLKDPICALKEATAKLRGSFAIAAVFSDYPNRIYAIRKESPLLVGVAEDGVFICSDIPAFLQHTDRYFRLSEGEIAELSEDGVRVLDKQGQELKKNLQHAPFDPECAKKDGHEHFMRKEIGEEPGIVARLISMYSDCHGIPKLDISEDIVKNTSHITVVACGTAYHAGLYLKYVFEKIADVRVDVHIASEFRYSLPKLDPCELTIFISQSGETADTLSSLKAAKAQGAKVLSIVNIVGSSIAMESDDVIYTHAGLEISVASTKAYAAQCTVSALLALYFAYVRQSADRQEISRLVRELQRIPSLISQILDNEEAIRAVAGDIKDAESLFFIGRRADHIAAIEGSLKLKEISYIHSEAYPAGELKHGTISLVTENTPVIALFGDEEMIPKTLSNLKEVASRGAPTIAISSPSREIAEVSDVMLDLPRTEPIFFPLTIATILQLLAYHTARLRGCDIDQPRNLAKSVTVE